MSIFSNIGKNISNKSKEISQKAKVMSESSSLNNIIKGEECKIDSQYKLIGKMYFEKYSTSPEAEFEPAIQAIKNSMEKISETREELVKIKSQYCCPSCGTSFKNGALFCSCCGAKLPQKDVATPVEPIQKLICTQCGNTLESGAVFCNVCGKKLGDQGEQKEKNGTLPDENTTFSQTTSQPTENTNTIPVQAVAEMPSEIPSAAIPDSIVVTSDKKTDNEIHEESVANAEVQKLFCPNCKNEISEDDLFCNECGTKVK